MMNSERFKQFTSLHYKHTRTDWIVSAFTIPVLGIIFNFLAFGTPYLLSGKKFLVATAFSTVLGFLIHNCMMYIVHFWRRRLPAIEQTTKRYFFSILSYTTVCLAMTCVLLVLYNKYHFLGFTFSMDFFWIFLLITVIAHAVIGTLYEFFYSMQKWKEKTQQNEFLEKEKLRSELAVLKSQVNPHFLFNTLNTLSALVNEDPSKAEDFIDDMSQVYRYLLRNNEEELSSLASELKFIRSYFQLLKTRHGNGIQMELKVSDQCLAYQLPPLTLQLLVENAVKHNIIRTDTPLQIEIFTEENRLTVRNKLQRKTQNVHSTKVGLNNIALKYKLLNQADLEIVDDGNIFSVSVPLIITGTK